MGGLLLAAGAAATWRQVRISREGQVTERFTRAVDQLGAEHLDVRLGGLYALERIARDSAGDRRTIAEVLTAYIRQRAPWPPSQPGQYRVDWPLEQQPDLRTRAPDVQAALTVLGRGQFPKPVRREAVSADRLDLRDVDLRKADLGGASLQGAELHNANLQGAYLRGANLQAAQLFGANLQMARLHNANLREADLGGADLRGADFLHADLREADFFQADLRGADFGVADLRGAKLFGANLEAARLHTADLRGTELGGAAGDIDIHVGDQAGSTPVDQRTTIADLAARHTEPEAAGPSMPDGSQPDTMHDRSDGKGDPAPGRDE